MAVGKVMHDLAHSPAAVPVRSVELGVVQAFDRSAQTVGKETERVDVRCAEFGSVSGGGMETTDGIAEIIQFCHGKKLAWLDEGGV